MNQWFEKACSVVFGEPGECDGEGDGEERQGGDWEVIGGAA